MGCFLPERKSSYNPSGTFLGSTRAIFLVIVCGSRMSASSFVWRPVMTKYFYKYISYCMLHSGAETFFYLKFLLDSGPFCGATGILSFGLQMTLLPMGFKARDLRVDSSSPALFCHLRTTIPRVISGCLDQASPQKIPHILPYSFEAQYILLTCLVIRPEAVRTERFLQHCYSRSLF